ncbi:MAG: hypothetical protein QXK71_02420 [Pyrobaculum sp.]|jgi:hypothetical protein
MPPAIFVLPLTSKEQVVQMVNYVVSKVKQLSVEVRHIHSDAPLYIESKNSRDGIMERVDVYLATSAGDYANVLPVREEIKEGFVEKVGFVHLVQGAAVLFRYALGKEPTLTEVVIYTVGALYKDFKLNL